MKMDRASRVSSANNRRCYDENKQSNKKGAASKTNKKNVTLETIGERERVKQKTKNLREDILLVVSQ
jgi:hypothetical protein